MAAFKNTRALLLVVALSSLFLSLTFAQDLPSPTAAPTAAEVEAPSPAGASELASPPTFVSFISSSPDSSPSSAPSPLPSSSSISTSTSSSSENYGHIYGIMETSVTTPVEVPVIGKDIQAQVTKLVQSRVIAVKSQTEEFMKNVITKRLNDPSTESDTRECLKQCKENYEDADDDISKVMDDLSTGDYYKAMVDVEGISTFVDTCNECLREMVGEEAEFKKFDDWVKGVTGDCLEQLDKINS